MSRFAANVAVGAMLADGRLELQAWDELQNFEENAAYSIRGGGLLTGCLGFWRNLAQPTKAAT